ncbi:MAG: glycosyltransferase [Candidatus Symbiothrix sp.]|jgi:glycosyltransferase involved in cell wall biosynthesis|nr:glycosyltransferase [Candidatus Symbiothrix sp.]
MNQISKTVFIHSLNNFTGSSNVLSVIIKEFIVKSYDLELITSKGGGFLSDLKDVKSHYTCYRWSENKFLTLCLFLISQLEVFFRVLFSSKRNTLYYINTIVPFGAALACWLTKKHYVYHVHENMQMRKPIYRIFRYVYKLCNKKSIFVSNYLQGTALNCNDGIVIYNSLNTDFVTEVENYQLKPIQENRTTILMVASLRRFKGVYEFVELAKRMPKYQFELVVNATEKEVDNFISEIGNIENLNIYSTQTNLHPFYQQAKLLLQLSHPELWIETFGLTILEAMVYGIPAIVPNVGGPVELVEDGINGYTINPHDLDLIASKITELIQDENLYEHFSEAALRKSKMFSESKMIDSIEQYITC